MQKFGLSGFSAKHSPFSDQQDVALQSIASGVPVGQVSGTSSDEDPDHSDASSPEVGSSEEPLRPPAIEDNLQDALLFHMNDVPLRVRLTWTDHYQMVQEIAGHFAVPRVQIEGVYEVGAQVEGIAEGAVPIIRHMVQNIPSGSDLRLVLLAIQFYGHKSEPDFVTGPMNNVQVVTLPKQATRQAVLVTADTDAYCAQEAGRCLVHVNHIRWPGYHVETKYIAHGDYVKVAVPPSDRYQRPTLDLARMSQSGMSHEEIIDQIYNGDAQSGYSPSLMDEAEVCQLAVDLSNSEAASSNDHHSVLQTSVVAHDITRKDQQGPQDMHGNVIGCSFTDEFLQAIRTAQEAEQFEAPGRPKLLTEQSVFVQELHERISEAVESRPNWYERPVLVESWFTDHSRSTRCHNSRITMLSTDFSTWEQQLLATWNDRSIAGVQTEFALVYPLLEEKDASVLAQVVIAQRPQMEHRSLVIRCTTLILTLQVPTPLHWFFTNALGIEEVIEDLRMDRNCPRIHPQNECILWLGSFAIQPMQKVHLMHGNALKLAIRRGIPVPLQDLLMMTDSDQALQNSIWGEIFQRPNYSI